MQNINSKNWLLQNKNSVNLVCFLLALMLLLPKILLVTYVNYELWGNFSGQKVINVILQDSLLAFFYFFILRWAFYKNKPHALILVCVMSALLLGTLLIDTRVRELWLRPISVDLIQYTFNNYKDLMSGSDVFLKYYGGLSMTFRRALILVFGIFFILFISLFYLRKCHSAKIQAGSGIKLGLKTWLWIGAITLIFVIIMAKNKSATYHVESNIVINPLVALFKNQNNADKNLSSVSFEQPLQALHSLSALANKADGKTDTVKPFKNVIIFILESVRYKGFNQTDASTANANYPMPFLKKLADAGLFAKCYVSVPHTSKSQFAILTGRNPLADIEMRESLIGKLPSIVSLLKETKGSSSRFITVQNLRFENTAGMLNAVGFEQLIGPTELSKLGSVVTSSSFGLFDDALLNYPYADIAKDKPFVIGFMTIATHYPYDYPNKRNQEDSSYAAYAKAAKNADDSLALLFDKLAKNNLFDNTLVVLVGDHGESFGEHGTFIHNSSMHEEEITVPLIFWSSDGRLKELQLRRQVRQIDIAPTIADLMGVKDNKNYILQGSSLIKRDDIEPPIFISTFFANLSQAIVHKQVKTILNTAEGTITQFDLVNDPNELSGKSINGPEYDQYLTRFKQYTRYHHHAFGKSD